MSGMGGEWRAARAAAIRRLPWHAGRVPMQTGNHRRADLIGAPPGGGIAFGNAAPMPPTSFANPLPGVPAIESPFLAPLLDSAGADDALIRRRLHLCHPMGREPAFGRVAYREVRDLRSGEAVPHRYLGREVPAGYIEAVRPPVKRLPGRLEAAYLAANPDVAAAAANAPPQRIFTTAAAATRPRAQGSRGRSSDTGEFLPA